MSKFVINYVDHDTAPVVVIMGAQCYRVTDTSIYRLPYTTPRDKPLRVRQHAEWYGEEFVNGLKDADGDKIYYLFRTYDSEKEDKHIDFLKKCKTAEEKAKYNFYFEVKAYIYHYYFRTIGRDFYGDTDVPDPSKVKKMLDKERK